MFDLQGLSDSIDFAKSMALGTPAIFGVPEADNYRTYLSIYGRLMCFQCGVIHLVCIIPSPLVSLGAALVLPMGVVTLGCDTNMLSLWGISIVGVVGFPVLHTLAFLRATLGMIVHPCIYITEKKSK